MGKMKKGSKQWWSMAATILGAVAKACSIPAMKDEHGVWKTHPKDKANLLATISSKKMCCLKKT